MCGNEGTCLLEIEFVLKTGKRREFVRSLEGLHSHEGIGHLRTVVFEDCEEPGHLIWIADWTSRAALEEYIESDEFRVLLGGLRVLGTVMDCRVIDEATTSVPVSSLLDRTPNERRFVRFDPGRTGRNPR